MSELMKNQSAKITKVLGDIHLRRRLFEFGLLPNQTVKILSVSPLKHTYLIEIKNYCLALRKSILDNIFVEII